LSRLLLFLDAPSEGEARLLGLLEDGDARPLVALLRECGLTPASLAKSVADAKMAFEREVARAEAVGAMPDVIEDLKKHAIDRPGKCPQCFGVKGDGMNGKTVVKLGTSVEICPRCDGTGLTMQSSAHKQWAATTLGRIASLPEDKAGMTVNMQQNVAVKAGAGAADFMERLSKAAHDVLTRPDVIDAEVVPSTPAKS